MFDTTLLKPSKKAIQEMQEITSFAQSSYASATVNPALKEALQRKILLDEMKERYLPTNKSIILLFLLIAVLLVSGIMYTLISGGYI